MTNKIECATCHKHLGGPAEAPASRVSHGICLDCLKKQSPGAYFFGRRRALQERLAAFDASEGISDLNGYFFSRGKK